MCIELPRDDNDDEGLDAEDAQTDLIGRISSIIELNVIDERNVKINTHLINTPTISDEVQAPLIFWP